MSLKKRFSPGGGERGRDEEKKRRWVVRENKLEKGKGEEILFFFSPPSFRSIFFSIFPVELESERV